MNVFKARPLLRVIERLGARSTLSRRAFAQSHRQQQFHRPQMPSCVLRSRSKQVPGQKVQGRRHASISANVQETRQYLKERPVFTAFIVVFFASLLGTIYAVYQYNMRHIVDLYNTFPAPVAQKLRRAIYYANYNPNPKLAVKHYREALALAEELGMDPYSDEMIGVKSHYAKYLEDIGQVHQSIALLQLTRDECQRWIGENKDKEETGRRAKILLKRVMGMTLKIGELYDHAYVNNPEMAGKNMNAAVTAVLGAKAKQEDERGERDEETWVSDEDVGGCLEIAADHYAQTEHFELSAPLYLRAIQLCPKTDCNIIYLMNGLAVSLASGVPPNEPGTPPADRAALFDAGRLWAQKALEVAAEIKPPDRTEKCDTGCATVIQNLGEMAETQGDVVEARQRYEEARSLSKAISYEVGVGVATAALARLDGSQSAIANA